jgi:hypothetical protein
VSFANITCLSHFDMTNKMTTTKPQKSITTNHDIQFFQFKTNICRLKVFPWLLVFQYFTLKQDLTIE